MTDQKKKKRDSSWPQVHFGEKKIVKKKFFRYLVTISSYSNSNSSFLQGFSWKACKNCDFQAHFNRNCVELSRKTFFHNFFLTKLHLFPKRIKFSLDSIFHSNFRFSWCFFPCKNTCKTRTSLSENRMARKLDSRWKQVQFAEKKNTRSASHSAPQRDVRQKITLITNWNFRS